MCTYVYGAVPDYDMYALYPWDTKVPLGYLEAWYPLGPIGLAHWTRMGFLGP